MKKSERIRFGDRITIYRRGKQQIYCAEFWRDRQHRRKSLRTRNVKIALQRAALLDISLANGTFTKALEPISIVRALDDYLSFLETEGRADTTLAKYLGVYNRFKDFMVASGVMHLGQVTIADYDRFSVTRHAAGLHHNTRAGDGVIITQFFRWCKSRKLIAENPLADIKVPQQRVEPRPGPNLEQVEQLLAALHQCDRGPITVLAFTGMRAGELRRLQPGDIDLKKMWIHIRSRKGAETKTRQSRKIPIHARLVELLKSQFDLGMPWLFTNQITAKNSANPAPLNTDDLNRRFVRIVAKLGMPAKRKCHGFTLHSFRHFVETHLVNARIPQLVIDAWLGHARNRSMAATYYRLSDDESQKFMRDVSFGVSESPSTDREV